MGGPRAYAAVVLLSVFLPAVSFADISIIDSPTASCLGHGEMRWEIGIANEGAVNTGLKVGAFERMYFGISFGMENALGRGDVESNPHPGVQLHVLAWDEIGLPAVAFGFDSQGQGEYFADETRYERKSLGFYGVVTQNLLGERWGVLTGLTGGVNYSMEGQRESFDLFAGISSTFGRNFSLLLDYDFGLDDRSGIDSNYGYLDFGVQLEFGRGNHIRFLLRDLMGNYRGQGQISRELNFFYLFRL
jgi:hypothetical protein